MSESEVDGIERVTDEFVAHRELLFSIVYNLLGSVADTEDVLQDAWLAWAARSRKGAAEPIANVRAYLVRIAVNQALARQASINRRREHYVGPWLPEPLITTPPGGAPAAETSEPGDAAEAVVRAETLSMALLVVLETLTPLQRAVFVLHEVFGYQHTEIAEIVDRAPSAVRQLSRRARKHVHERRPRYPAQPRVRQQVTERFLAAALGGDLNALMDVLAPDVTLWTDGGGKVRQTILRPLHGRDKVARLIAGVADRTPAGVDLRYRTVNGDPAAVLVKGESAFAVMVIELTPDEQQVSEIYAVTNPDKLTRIN
ncbi:RNA polymerase sigma factor SigJ [Streptomyces sp. NPDC001795]|uniref:RNA polymerase sigma factor SigJ n=1 Tax=unclassified Streptomyces TaxID=2593676 RepID=UPI003323D529